MAPANAGKSRKPWRALLAKGAMMVSSREPRHTSEPKVSLTACVRLSRASKSLDASSAFIRRSREISTPCSSVAMESSAGWVQSHHTNVGKPTCEITPLKRRPLGKSGKGSSVLCVWPRFLMRMHAPPCAQSVPYRCHHHRCFHIVSCMHKNHNCNTNCVAARRTPQHT